MWTKNHQKWFTELKEYLWTLPFLPTQIQVNYTIYSQIPPNIVGV